MTKQRVLSDKQIKTLVTLYVNYKKAEAEFNEAKKILTANLECGKYEMIYPLPNNLYKSNRCSTNFSF